MDTKEVIEKLKEMDAQPVPETPEMPDAAETEETLKGTSGKSFYARLRDGEITPADIPDALREEWTRTILGDTTFAYTVPLLNGRVGFVFGELDGEKASLYRRFSHAAGPDIDTQTRLCIVLFLREITGDVQIRIEPTCLEKDQAAIHTPAVSIEKAYDELCSQIPVGLSKMLLGAWTVYSTLVGLLTQEAFPDSF